MAYEEWIRVKAQIKTITVIKRKSKHTQGTQRNTECVQKVFHSEIAIGTVMFSISTVLIDTSNSN